MNNKRFYQMNEQTIINLNNVNTVEIYESFSLGVWSTYLEVTFTNGKTQTYAMEDKTIATAKMKTMVNM